MCVGVEKVYLKRTTASNSLVRVERGADVLAEELDDPFLNGGNPSGAADYLHRVDVIPAQFCNQTVTGIKPFLGVLRFQPRWFSSIYFFLNKKMYKHTCLFKDCFQWRLQSCQIRSTKFFELGPEIKNEIDIVWSTITWQRKKAQTT